MTIPFLDVGAAYLKLKGEIDAAVTRVQAFEAEWAAWCGASHAAALANVLDALIHYPIAPHRQAADGALHLAESSLPIPETLAAEVLSSPIGTHMGAEERDAVVRAITGGGA